MSCPVLFKLAVNKDFRQVSNLLTDCYIPANKYCNQGTTFVVLVDSSIQTLSQGIFHL